MAAPAATHATVILLALRGDADAASLTVNITTYQYVAACASGRLRGRDDVSNDFWVKLQAFRTIAPVCSIAVQADKAAAFPITGVAAASPARPRRRQQSGADPWAASRTRSRAL